ncbi:hypothetical protein [Pleionea sp. CnH1-48]|nr:hypothetical protein [Pleionea sp. CnH1-48]MCO7227293.1 hypothetical protein [Pleionea sp. CnH1-48]
MSDKMNKENDSQDSKKKWEKPECHHLSTKDTKGGGFGGNETTTTKPGS